MLLIGGQTGPSTFSTAVSAYDPTADSWEALGTLDTGANGGGLRAAVIGDVAYWLDGTAEKLRWVDLTTFDAGMHDGPIGGFTNNATHLHAFDGKLYMMGGVQQTFDPDTGDWTAVTQADEAVIRGNAALDEATGRIYVASPNMGLDEMWFAYYDISLDAWTTLNPPTSDVFIGVGGTVADGRVYLPGGINPTTTAPLTNNRVYDTATDTWELEKDTPSGAYTLLADAFDLDRVWTLIASSVDATTFQVTLISLQLEVEAWLDVTATIDLPVAGVADAWLTIGVDVTGGPGVAADLLVTFNTGRVIVATAPLVVDVTDDPEPWTAPETNLPDGATPVIQPREWSECETPRARTVCNSDEYAIDWRPGGQPAGTVKGFGADATPTPEDGLNLAAEHDTALEWSIGDATSITRSYRQSTVEAATSEALPELMPVDQLDLISGLTVGGCLKPVTATLCSDTDVVVTCLALGLVPEVLPTRLQLAHQAAEAAGVTLFILNGTAGLPQANEAVDAAYRTEGKTLATVLEELLLEGGAAHWYAPGAVLVNGGGLPEVTLTRPTVYGESGSVTLDRGEAFTDPEPDLDEYLTDCAEYTSESDPCEGETFETAYSGTLSWVERAGSGRDYTEIHTTLTKSGGRIVKEEVVTHRAMWVLERDITQPGGLTGSYVIAPVEWHLREYTYLACCPQALTHSTERIWVAPSNTNPSADWADAYRVKLASAKEVTQRWNAEGWLASRIETTWEQHGWRTEWTPHGQVQAGVTQFDNYVIVPTYKATTRIERYVPVGDGLWHVHVSVSEGLQMPVDDGASSFEVVGNHWGDKISTYTQVTDQAPPSVSCDEPGTDPCTGGDCVTVRTADWQRDHAAWTARAASWSLNQPDQRVVTTVTYPGRVTSLLPGTVRDEGLVAAVSWSGASVRTGRPGESTTIEYWGGLAAES